MHCLIFDHFLIFKVLKFYFWMRKCTSPCFVLYIAYFCKLFILHSELDKLFQPKFILNSFEVNDVDALVAIIFFVQDREPLALMLYLVEGCVK